MKQIQQVVSASLGYKRTGAAMISVYLGWIIACLTGNKAFPNLPIPLVPTNPPDPTKPVDLTTRKANLDAAIAACQGGGTLATSAKNAALQSVIDGLDATAFYCQTTARYDLHTFLTSGFQPEPGPVGTGRAVGDGRGQRQGRRAGRTPHPHHQRGGL
jgi:hypothetical protein